MFLKSYKVLLLFLLVNSTSLKLLGQDEEKKVGIAGPDKEMVCGEERMIGTTGKGEACYLWTPSTGLADPTAPQTIASPTISTTYQLVEMGENFESRVVDRVRVEVIPFEKIEVEPFNCCWKVGDPITIEQFKITTVPPEVEQNFTIDITVAPEIGFTSDVIELTITHDCGSNNSTSAKVDITVVDESFELRSAGISVGLDAFEGYLKAFNFGASPCQPTLSIMGSPALSEVYICCPLTENCVKQSTSLTGAISVTAGIGCSIPFYGVPKIASLNVDFGGSINGEIKRSNTLQCTNRLNECLDVGLKANVEAGISAKALDGVLIDANLKGVLEANIASSTYCIENDRWNFGKRTYRLDAKGTIKFLSLVEHKLVDQNIIKPTCF